MVDNTRDTAVQLYHVNRRDGLCWWIRTRGVHGLRMVNIRAFPLLLGSSAECGAQIGEKIADDIRNGR
jgi:hypothetical protein